MVNEDGPFLHSDERTNRLLVIGSDEQIEKVRSLLLLLDLPPHEYAKLILEIYRPLYVEAEEARQILEDLGIIRTSGPETARERAQEYELDGANSTGPAEQSRQAISSSQSSTRAFGQEPFLLPGEEESEIRVAVQQDTNKLFVLATAFQHQDIKLIMEQLDMDAEDVSGEIQIFALENREPAFVASALQELLESSYVEVSDDKAARVPGKEGAPIIVPLEDIYAVAVRGTPRQREDIGKIIKILDKRLPQVLVEAILIQVSVDDSLSLGISAKQSTSVSDSRRISGISPFSLGDIVRAGSIVAGEGAVVAFFDDDFVFATLEALHKQGNSRIISKPRILVSDNNAGVIISERGEPTTSTTISPGSDTPIVTFSGYETAGTTLTITPHIGDVDSKALQLEIELSVNNFEGESSGNIPPPTSNNSIKTWVTVPDGKTIILGGLTREIDAMTQRKVPFFGDIPLIGAAFRSTTRTKDRGVLYVFVKAHIVGREGPDGETFQDLDQLTENEKYDLKRRSLQYKSLTVIPGLPDEKQSKQNDVLDYIK
ncbi:MAG: type II secretion system protein GspD [Planctomycetes bacterium]|nr:type II secretion system protein GspD [Planctomycetota bacterium]